MHTFEKIASRAKQPPFFGGVGKIALGKIIPTRWVAKANHHPFVWGVKKITPHSRSWSTAWEKPTPLVGGGG